MKSIKIFRQIKNDLKLVEQELKTIVIAPNPLLTEASSHLLNAGGKRLRPAFTLLAGKFYDYNFEKLKPLAVALELIHMASLVHDDVVDRSMTRRGIPTVKAKWEDQVSIYTGDYLFAKSLILISECDNPSVSKVLADVSVKMCEGEVQQLYTAFDANQTLRDYFYRIKRKTALLISASCQCGALITEAPKQTVMALTRYGHYLGMAFQITDDILDMVADQKELGKPVGGDLRQGIVTLPVIYALEHSPMKEELYRIVRKKVKTQEEISRGIEIVKTAGGIEYSFEISRKYLDKAKEQIELLPDVDAKASLKTIADFINVRKF